MAWLHRILCCEHSSFAGFSIVKQCASIWIQLGEVWAGNKVCCNSNPVCRHSLPLDWYYYWSDVLAITNVSVVHVWVNENEADILEFAKRYTVCNCRLPSTPSSMQKTLVVDVLVRSHRICVRRANITVNFISFQLSRDIKANLALGLLWDAMKLLLLSERRWPPFSGLREVIKASLIRAIPPPQTLRLIWCWFRQLSCFNLYRMHQKVHRHLTSGPLSATGPPILED